MFQMMLNFPSLLVLSCIILQTRGTLSDTNVVLCSGISKQEVIECPQDYIIDVNSVTVATLSENQTCSTNVTQAIDQEKHCKSVTGDKGRYVIFRRCHGKQRCIVGGSVVDSLSFGPNCKINMRVVWFNYSCSYVNSSLPSIALLPVSEDRHVQGFEVEIFSPYYPCYTVRPKTITSWQCQVSPKRKDKSSLVSYVLRSKAVEIRRNSGDCGDYLSFRLGDTNRKHYCGNADGDIEHWNEDTIFGNTTEYLTVRFQSKTIAGGAKFWLVVEAFENEEHIEVNLTCNGQENIPPLSSDCSILPVTPAPNSTNEITPNADKDTPKGFLFGILGGLFVLLLLVGVAVFLLVSVFRKRQQEKNTPPAAPPKLLRPRSMQQLATLLKPRRKTPFYPETELPADGGATATGGDNSGSGHRPTTPVRAVENYYVDNQMSDGQTGQLRSVAGSANNLNSGHSPDLNNNDGYDAVMCENGGLNIPTAVPTVSEEVCENETVEAGSEQLYALPKKVNGPGTQNDEIVMCENADLYSPASDETASPEIPPESLLYEAVFGKDMKS